MTQSLTYWHNGECTSNVHPRRIELTAYCLLCSALHMMSSEKKNRTVLDLKRVLQPSIVFQLSTMDVR